MGFINIQDTQQPAGLGNGRYPFRDTATLRSDTGVVLPGTLFIDASLYPPGASEYLYLSSLSWQVSKLLLTISNENGVVCSASGDLQTSVLALRTPGNAVCGVLVGSPQFTEFLTSIPSGALTFTPDATSFVPTCVLPQPPESVLSFTGPDSRAVSGNVWLVGKDGIVFEPVADTNTIKIHAIGNPWAAQNQCAGVGTPLRWTVPIKKINIIMEDQASAEIALIPTDRGNVVITAGSQAASDPILQVIPQENGIQITSVDFSENPL